MKRSASQGNVYNKLSTSNLTHVLQQRSSLITPKGLQGIQIPVSKPEILTVPPSVSKHSLNNYRIETGPGGEKIVKRDWPVLSTRALSSYLPRNEVSLRARDKFDYPTQPVDINTSNLDITAVKSKMYKLKTSKNLALRI